MELNIQIGKEYNCFDDGKIKQSRLYTVIITNIIKFADIDKETLNFWQEEVKQCHWLYTKETDYFLFGDLYISDDTIEKVIFVRTIDFGWFSLGYWAGRLDVDGSLIEHMLKYTI